MVTFLKKRKYAIARLPFLVPFLVLFLVLFIALPVTVLADIKSRVILDLGNVLAINPGPHTPETRYLVNGTGKFLLEATGSRDVKAQLGLLATLGSAGTNITIDRAYVLVRFDKLRLTVGKTRVGWGEGAAFNAADLVMGSTDVTINLSSSELRDETLWLAGLYLSLDRFTFLEALFLPPLPDPINDRVAFGARFLTEVDDLNLKLEGGYFYRAKEDLHQIYVSFQGGQGLNWHLSSSLGMNTESFQGTADDFFKNLQISGGLYFLESIDRVLRLGMRAEVIFQYGKNFTEQNDILLSLPATYGVYGYLETSLSIEQSTNFFLRSIISPVDVSAILIIGGNFTIYQGLSFYSDASVQFGDQNDTFANNRLGGYTLGLGLRFVY